MKALVVDDSRLARQELRHLLAAHPEVEVVGEAAQAEEGVRLVESLQPDLLFLDIQMPGASGFDLLERLEYVPNVIFTTAYDQYALQAFEYNALDYLLKPIRPERLAAALGRLAAIRPADEPTGDRPLLGLEDQVFVKEGERCWFVQLDSIRLFEADQNATRLYFGEARPLISRSLNYMEGRLDSRFFFRASRQHIVNIRWVERVEPWFSGTLRLYLKGGQTVDVSRRQTSRFKELMSF